MNHSLYNTHRYILSKEFLVSFSMRSCTLYNSSSRLIYCSLHLTCLQRSHVHRPQFALLSSNGKKSTRSQTPPSRLTCQRGESRVLFFAQSPMPRSGRTNEQMNHEPRRRRRRRRRRYPPTRARTPRVYYARESSLHREDVQENVL